MIIKNNYNECLTNLACSIRKYFGLDYHHKTLKDIDNLLDKNQPKNVVLVLLDGMGSNILNRTLDENSFLRKNKVKNITSVFPATTTAATTSIRTGLNPIEHGWLGWNTYLKPIDQTITLFLGVKKETGEKSLEFIENQDLLQVSTIAQDINNYNKGGAIELFPFPTGDAIVYDSLSEFKTRILDETKKEGKRFIYAYNDEPDHTMHEKGPDSIEAKNLIRERNDFIEDLYNNLTNTLLIVVADHGHIKVDNLFLKDHPNIKNMLERVTSSEPRAIALKVKDEYKDVFPEEFNKEFGKYFTLYSKDEVIESGLYGEGKMHQVFIDALGDYIAIADKSNKTILDTGDEELVSQHAGYTDDEIYVPLIIKLKK